MSKMIDLTGQRFLRLTVIKFSHSKKYNGRSWGQPYWLCQCDCGNEKTIKGYHLVAQKIQSCGCLRREVTALNKTTHGGRHTKLYGTWSKIRQRCENKNDSSYKNYGARGIKVCERWQSFDNFNSDMASTWFIGASIERKNVNGNYEPDNCLWIPLKDQAKNKTTSIILETPWGTMNAMYVAKILGISPGTMFDRIHKWPKERWLEPKHH